MKKKFLGILLATVLTVSSGFGMNGENVYADTVNDYDNSTVNALLQSGA